MRVTGAPAQANADDGGKKPAAKGKHELDLSEVWAAIFAQAGALYRTAGHAAASARGEVQESPSGRAETPSAAETSLVRAPGDVSTERMLSQGWAMVHRPSATATPSDGIQRADGGAEGTPQAGDRLLDTRDRGAWVHSARTAQVAEKAQETAAVQRTPQADPHASVATRGVQRVARVSVDHIGVSSVRGTSGSEVSVESNRVLLGNDAMAKPERTHGRTERPISSSSGETTSHSAAVNELRASVAAPVIGSVDQYAQRSDVAKSDIRASVTSTLGSLGEDLRAWVTSTEGADPKTLTVALEPKELGSMKVIVHHGDEGLQIQLVASTAASANLLAAQLPTLMQQMAQGGLSVRDVSVGLATDAGEAGGGERQRDRGDGSVGGTAGAGTLSSSRLARAGYGAKGEYPMSLINLYA
ncbi:flagellar hook-length control protein FliK [Alicyclobacillus acidocaldarius]|nr:flagellar hook-length control protein FliK [Alicyclobacillus acidocaldarius]